ncbi:methyltransferase domain-containing protein [Geodermatophilus sp. URMC 61]|uniref:methyltransferase domain-containing protein n=1 Tax=Geodermatophilus sp. URMC 61 TaxID=3423411 RepID=UPI00406CCB6C
MSELVGTGPGTAWSGGGSGQPHAAVDTAFAVGRSCGETARLQRQAEELAPESRYSIERTALGPGQRAIDVGCGPRGILELLVEFVGPAGRVVGLDSDPALLELAARFAAERGWDNVELICADARHSGLPSDTFDVVHARTLLIGLPQPADVLTELVRLTRPGGWVVGMEPDAEHPVCHPPHPAVDRLSELLRRALARRGADPHLGRRLAELYRQAGLTDVTVEVRAPVCPPGHSRRTVLADLVRSLRAPVLGLGLATERELEELDASARAHLTEPDTLVIPDLFFLARGRKSLSSPEGPPGP